MEQHINTKRSVTTVTKTLTLDLIDAHRCGYPARHRPLVQPG